MIRDTIILSIAVIAALIGAMLYTPVAYVTGHSIAALCMTVFVWQHYRIAVLFALYEVALLSYLCYLPTQNYYLRIDTELWCVLSSMMLWRYWGKLPMIPLGVICIGSFVQLFNEYLGDIHNWNLIDLIILVVALYWVYHEYRLKKAN